jgi:hypothetical protein
MGEGAGVAKDGGGAGAIRGEGRGAGGIYSEGTKKSSSDDDEGQSEKMVVTPSLSSLGVRVEGLLVQAGPPQVTSMGTRTYVSLE